MFQRNILHNHKHIPSRCHSKTGRWCRSEDNTHCLHMGPSFRSQYQDSTWTNISRHTQYRQGASEATGRRKLMARQLRIRAKQLALRAESSIVRIPQLMDFVKFGDEFQDDV